jgi:hypothetical protein
VADPLERGLETSIEHFPSGGFDNTSYRPAGLERGLINIESGQKCPNNPVKGIRELTDLRCFPTQGALRFEVFIPERDAIEKRFYLRPMFTHPLVQEKPFPFLFS